MAIPQIRHSILVVLAALSGSAAGAAPTGAASPAPRDAFPASCSALPDAPSFRRIPPGDAWRRSSTYDFPFRGWTDRGPGTILWKPIASSALRRAKYPAPNLPSCRVGRFGTEDRGTTKAGRHFAMLEPLDGVRSYQLRDTFDRPVAQLQYFADPPVKYHPSKWGWFIDGVWAGHDAARAFELQGRGCKLVAGQTATGWRWVRDSASVIVAFNPGLGSPGRGYAPRNTRALRVRAFVDRRAIPPALLAAADGYDFGCGSPVRGQWQPPRTLEQYVFDSRFGPNRSFLSGYYFGEGATALDLLPGEARLYNNYPLSNYNPRPQFNHAAYVMAATTGVAGGGMVRGVVRATRDQLALHDEMRYCDPNYTLRHAQITKGKKHYRKSLYWAPATYSRENRPAVRWVFGRIDPDPATLTPEQQAAAAGPVGERLFGWLPIYCDRPAAR
jgi:hypothetical protein